MKSKYLRQKTKNEVRYQTLEPKLGSQDPLKTVIQYNNQYPKQINTETIFLATSQWCKMKILEVQAKRKKRKKTNIKTLISNINCEALITLGLKANIMFSMEAISYIFQTMKKG